VVWAAYSPIPEHHRRIQWAIDRANAASAEFTETSKALPTSRPCHLCEFWEQRAGDLARWTTADIYWANGYGKLVAWCLLPPLLGYAALVIAWQLIQWVRAGFQT
jgi:hypothetical protein